MGDDEFARAAGAHPQSRNQAAETDISGFRLTRSTSSLRAFTLPCPAWFGMSSFNSFTRHGIQTGPLQATRNLIKWHGFQHIVTPKGG
jgi:hypothetical protein